MRARVVVKCKKCGSDSVIVEKFLEYNNEDEYRRQIIKETLCHDGWGWDLNTFTVKCAKCGEKIEEVTIEKGLK